MLQDTFQEIKKPWDRVHGEEPADMGLIRFYQKSYLRAYRGRAAFWPSCSEYAIEAINTYGISKGL